MIKGKAYLAIGSEVMKAVHVLQLVQGGLAGGALLTPSQGPKSEVASVLGGQQARGLPSFSHAQCNAWSCIITMLTIASIQKLGNCLDKD